MADYPKIKLAILQRVCPVYRKGLFRQLSSDKRITAKLFLGEDIPNSKVKSDENLDNIHYIKHKTRFIKIGHRVFGWNIGLIKSLKEFNPDVILCEGDSHFIGYVRAIIYRILFNKQVALIHWCFTSRPGEPLRSFGIISIIKKYFRQHFDAFLLYSTFSRDRLVGLGIPAHRTFVATNVGDMSRFLKASNSLKISPSEARVHLKLPERFTVLYSGTLDSLKKPEMMLDLASICNPDKFNFMLIGSGELLEELRQRVIDDHLSNVYLPGRVTDDLFYYYKASDTLMIPRKSGIIISEAMAFGIPVIVHHADGTEYDLVKNNKTGMHLVNDQLSDFRQAIEFLQKSPEQHALMGRQSKELLRGKYTTENMVESIIKATYFAYKGHNTKH